MSETANLNDSSVQGETVPVPYCSQKERLLSELYVCWWYAITYLHTNSRNLLCVLRAVKVSLYFDVV